MEAARSPLILFDGICDLCNRSVQFVIKHDSKKIFHFASLQGQSGQALLNQFQLAQNQFSSFVLFVDNQVYTKSTGVLKLFWLLGGFWRCWYIFIIIPPFIRDSIYNFIARNRYRWFGKREVCMVPTQELRERFLL